MKVRTPYKVLLLIIITLGIYYPVIYAPLNSTDDLNMVNGLFNIDHVTLRDIFVPGTWGYYYRPLLGLTFLADKYLWGLQESFMHLENIVIHAFNVVIVFYIARFIFRRLGQDSALTPMIAAILFALHPINTESVNWISGRTDLLAGAFIFTSLLLLLQGLEAESSLLLVLAAGTFFLACFAKDVAVFFFPVAVFIAVSFEGEQSPSEPLLHIIRKGRTTILLYSLASAIYFLFRHLAFKTNDAGISQAVKGFLGHDANGVLYNLRVIVKLIGFYGKKLIFPWPLNFAIVHVGDYYLFVGIIFAALGIYLIYRRDLLAALLISSYVMVAPSFLIALSRMAWTPVAERYLYISSATFAIAIVYLGLCICQSYKIPAAVASTLVVILIAGTAWGTAIRTHQWQDNLLLYEDTFKKSPDFPPVRNQYAIALKEHGRHEEGDAIIKTNTLPRDNPNNEFLEINKAKLYMAQGDFDTARNILLKCTNPDSKTYHLVLEKLIMIDERRLDMTKQKKEIIYQEIISFFSVLENQTHDPFYDYKLGQYYLAINDKPKAKEHFIRAYNNGPDAACYKMPAKKLANEL